MTTELKWGETPWDNLSREELLREVQRMYAAILALGGVVDTARRIDEASPFWRPQGRGGRAMAKANAILEPLHEQYDSDDIYRCFFRYALDLLFSPEQGFGWTACDGCPHLYGEDADLAEEHRSLGKPCKDCEREGRHFIRRPLEWKDLQRKDGV